MHKGHKQEFKDYVAVCLQKENFKQLNLVNRTETELVSANTDHSIPQT